MPITGSQRQCHTGHIFKTGIPRTPHLHEESARFWHSLDNSGIKHIQNREIIFIIIDCFYIALVSAQQQAHCAHNLCDSEWVRTHIIWLFHGWCQVKLLPSPCTFCVQHTTMYQFTVSLHLVHVCLAVTCYLQFWQNDQDLWCATVVTWGWNRYQNKSQHRKLTLGRKIHPLLQQGLKPVTFRSWDWHSNHSYPPPKISDISVSLCPISKQSERQWPWHQAHWNWQGEIYNSSFSRRVCPILTQGRPQWTWVISPSIKVTPILTRPWTTMMVQL